MTTTTLEWTDARIREDVLGYASYLADVIRTEGICLNTADRLSDGYQPGRAIDGRKFILAAQVLRPFSDYSGQTLRALALVLLHAGREDA